MLGQIQHMYPFKCYHLQLYLSITTVQLIFPSSGVNRHGNISTANWQGLDTCQQQTHVVEKRFAPGKLFMQTDLWCTKLKLLNGDIHCILISEWECPTVLAESNTPPPQLWFIRMYQPTQNARVWDMTSLSKWPRLKKWSFLPSYEFGVFEVFPMIRFF